MSSQSSQLGDTSDNINSDVEITGTRTASSGDIQPINPTNKRTTRSQGAQSTSLSKQLSQAPATNPKSGGTEKASDSHKRGASNISEKNVPPRQLAKKARVDASVVSSEAETGRDSGGEDRAETELEDGSTGGPAAHDVWHFFTTRKEAEANGDKIVCKRCR